MAGKCKDQRWDDLNLTRDEVERLGEALKKEEFRKLLQDYAEEVNDPENKKQYEREIIELEKERGIDVTFVNPEPGYVIKSSVDGHKKAFINICKNDKVGKPVSELIVKSGTRGLNWSLPYTQAPPRDDFDKNGNRCTVFDVVFHPDTHRLAENNAQFKKMLNNTALDAVEDNFEVQLDRKNVKFPKMKYKGAPKPTVIRKKMDEVPLPSEDGFSIPEEVYPYRAPVDQVKCDEARKKREQEGGASDKPETPYTIPKYVIKHRQAVDIQDFSNTLDAKMNAATPKELVVEVQLPLLNSSADMTLDVTEKSISLVSEKPAKYKLEVSLPYTVNEEAGSAKFDKMTRKLTITLPVRKHGNISLVDIGREDSGVESDLGRRTPDSTSDEEEEEITSTNQNSVIALQSSEITADKMYRTMSLVETKQFLSSDVRYTLPAFTCNVVDNIMAFTLHVKNVDPFCIEHCFLGEKLNGVHIKFTSIGAGFFPIHYAFCLKFPAGASISEDSFNAEAWDNNVIVQMEINLSDANVVEYYAGLDESSLVKFDLPEPSAISRKLEQLEVDSEDNKADVIVEVTKYTETEVSIEISPKNTASTVEEDYDDDELYEMPAPPTESQKSRTMSESSGDELSYSPTKKGILKNNARVSRSLSESSVDDYVWSSSLDMVTQSGSESCIPEEGTEEERETKKTVRFNEVVSQKTYRTNSSILGQRKKNQRKTRNKRRSQERRASESENSEGEGEREREVQTEPITGEDIEEEPSDMAPSPTNKASPKGKRKNRKGAGTQIEFTSDLIFDLDM